MSSSRTLARDAGIDTGAVPTQRLTAGKLIVLIIGAMTPIAVVGGTMPLGFAFGGPSTALMFLVAGCIIGIFCVGYSQMVRRITRPGAFYTYVARGLGRPAGLAVAMIAIIGYIGGLTGNFAISGFTVQESLATLFGVAVPWQLIVVCLAVIVAFITLRSINVSAGIVFTVVASEVIMLIALVISIIAEHGSGALSLEVFTPQVLTLGQWSVAFIFAFLCYQGYEAGALYAPETKNAEKAVPRALYGALVIITGLFFLVSWTLTSTVGIENMTQVVTENGIVGWMFMSISHYLGPVGSWLFSFILLFAVLAVSVTIVNFMSRYLQSLARDRVLPRYLASTNRVDSPVGAILTLLGIATILPLIVPFFGLDPMTDLSSVGFGIGALAATLIQAITSVAVFVFFLRRPDSERHWWKTATAPALAAVLLFGAVVIELLGFQWITGSEAPWARYLPLAVFAMALIGVLLALWFRRNRSEIYEDLAAGDTAAEAVEIRRARIARNQSEQEASKP